MELCAGEVRHPAPLRNVLHTDQQRPHVHMVVKAEREFVRRLHIDKEMLCQWREDFAQLMREQGIAANATPRIARGRNTGRTRDARHRAQRRGASTALRADVMAIDNQLQSDRNLPRSCSKSPVESRKAVVAHWMQIADAVDAQGEIALAGDVRYSRTTCLRCWRVETCSRGSSLNICARNVQK
jgi:hypothetical protein